MKILVDTCTFILLNLTPQVLSDNARKALESADNELYLSAVSVWEMSTKYMLGRLPLQERPELLIPRTREANGISPLPLTEDDALQQIRLPAVHKDPFDRMLVAQAISNGLAILTPDPEIARYPVRVIW